MNNQEPTTSLRSLVDDISVRTYRELEETNRKRIAADKAAYGKDFDRIRDEWIEKNRQLQQAEDAVWNLKEQFENKVNRLKQLQNNNSKENTTELAASLDDIIAFINSHKDIRIDDANSFYFRQSQPELTFGEYLEKYGYGNYFQNLRQECAKQLGEEKQVKEEPKIEPIKEQSEINEEPEAQKPQETIQQEQVVEAVTSEQKVDIPQKQEELISKENHEQIISGVGAEKEHFVQETVENVETKEDKKEEIRDLQKQKYKMLYLELMQKTSDLTTQMEAIGLTEEEKRAIMSELSGQIEATPIQEENVESRSI